MKRWTRNYLSTGSDIDLKSGAYLKLVSTSLDSALARNVLGKNFIKSFELAWLTIGKVRFVQYLSVFLFIWLQRWNNKTASRRKDKVMEILGLYLLDEKQIGSQQ